MAGDSKAKVIPLHKHSGNQRRHPSTLTGPAERASADQVAALVREIEERRAATVALGVAEPNPGEFTRRVAGSVAFLRERITGDYQVDEFGFDPHFNEAVALPLLRFFFNEWFRIEVSGVENLPAEGPALVVANHAGVLPMDALMLSVAVRDHHPAQRGLRMLGADLVFDLPVIGPAARKAGHTMACTVDANRLLAAGELTAVFPEGYKGLGKRFKDRYKLQRFGRGGFVSAALHTKAPVVPCSIVASEASDPLGGDLARAARALGLPSVPISAL